MKKPNFTLMRKKKKNEINNKIYANTGWLMLFFIHINREVYLSAREISVRID